MLYYIKTSVINTQSIKKHLALNPTYDVQHVNEIYTLVNCPRLDSSLAFMSDFTLNPTNGDVFKNKFGDSQCNIIDLILSNRDVV